VPIINEGLTPSAAQLDQARRVVAAFAASGDAGVTSLDGRMLDRPHLYAAERILGLARAAPQPRPEGLGMRKSSSTTA
jgi:citrate lyase subunit beta/citryl-CoA lyase